MDHSGNLQQIAAAFHERCQILCQVPAKSTLLENIKKYQLNLGFKGQISMSTRADLVEKELPGQKRVWQKCGSTEVIMLSLILNLLTSQPSLMFLFILNVCVNALKH